MAPSKFPQLHAAVNLRTEQQDVVSLLQQAPKKLQNKRGFFGLLGKPGSPQERRMPINSSPLR